MRFNSGVQAFERKGDTFEIKNYYVTGIPEGCIGFLSSTYFDSARSDPDERHDRRAIIAYCIENKLGLVVNCKDSESHKGSFVVDASCIRQKVFFPATAENLDFIKEFKIPIDFYERYLDETVEIANKECSEYAN